VPPEPLKGASSMTKIALLLASTLTVALSSQIAWGKDPSMAEDVQGMFSPTVSGAGPVSLVGVIDRTLSGQTEDSGPVLAEIINRSEQVFRLSTLSYRETKWPPSPYSAQALHRGRMPR
jgi:hypothetical protein